MQNIIVYSLKMASQRSIDKLFKENEGPPEVVNLLISMFGSVLPPAVIKSVGFNCHWNGK